MEIVASRELRNHTAELLRKVAAGDTLLVTVNGSPAAVLSPVPGPRRAYLHKAEAVDLLTRHPADFALSADLEELAGDTTDDLGPIR